MDSVADMVANIWGVDGIEYRVQADSPVGMTVQIISKGMARPNFAGLGVSKIWGSCDRCSLESWSRCAAIALNEQASYVS